MCACFTRVSLALVLAGTMIGGTARADVIVIQEGNLGFSFDPPGGFWMAGDLFGIAASLDSPGVGTTSVLTCGFPASCPPGTAISLGGVFGGEAEDFALGVGSAGVGGTSYGLDVPIEFRGTLVFDAPTVVVPSTPDGLASLTAPFLFHGSLAGFAEGSVEPLFDVQLTGRGRAGLELGSCEVCGIPGPYQFLGFGYEFEPAAPVPEPATMLLVSTGIVGWWSRRRLRQQITKSPNQHVARS